MDNFTDPLFIDKWERDLMTDNKTHKNHFDETFIDYILVQNKNKIIIKGKLIYNMYEKFGIYFLYIIGPLIIYYLPLRGSIAMVAKLILIVLAFIVSRKIISKLFSLKILEIDRETKKLKSSLDGFAASLSDINEISIIEETYYSQGKESMKYRLKLVLPEGEKSSIFAFTSYDSAKEILELIKTPKLL